MSGPLGLADLEAKARAATPGPFHLRLEEPEFMIPYWALMAGLNNVRCRIFHEKQDAEYYAAASPDVVLRLIARIKLADGLADAAAMIQYNDRHPQRQEMLDLTQMLIAYRASETAP